MDFDGIFLDMYGTLTTGDRAAVEATCATIIDESGLRMTSRELSITWGERFFAAMDATAQTGFETLLELEARTLRETMSALGTAVEPYHFVKQLVEYWADPPLQPEAHEFLAALKVPVCIVSNADRADIDAALRRHEVCVAGVVTSEDVRVYKPDRRIFDMALAQMGWRRERVIHVGDSLHSDVGGAIAAGLRSGWVNRAHRIHDVGNHTPDHEFSDLLELAAFLAR